MREMDTLIERAMAGDEDAFVDLMESQMTNLYKAARSLLSSEDDVADAISDTILTCWEKLYQLREKRYFRTWMTRILMNQCMDIHRKRQRVVYLDEMPDAAFHDPGYENREWLEALQSLNQPYRIAVILYYIEGFKVSEVAEILDIPEATVRTRLARARKKLAEEYEYGGEKRRRQI